MAGSPDIDIDFADRQTAIGVMLAVGCTNAMVLKDGKRTAHPSGVYLQDVPVDPFTNMAALDYKEAERHGYFKIDLLNQSVYQGVRDEDHLVELLNAEPEWSFLEESNFVEQLPHIHSHFDVVQAIRPKSINDLAVVLALIRPGKRQLLGRSRAEIDKQIWVQTEGEYSFKKAHAVSYGALIVVQMNLLVAKMLAELEAEAQPSEGWSILD